jgi:hypothetical protein
VAWITSIEGEPLKDILKEFTAQEIAEALDAPQAAIDHALSHLPDKKRQLTTEYLRKGISSRQTESFDALFMSILAHLRIVALGAGSESSESGDSGEGGENVTAA